LIGLLFSGKGLLPQAVEGALPHAAWLAGERVRDAGPSAETFTDRVGPPMGPVRGRLAAARVGQAVAVATPKEFVDEVQPPDKPATRMIQVEPWADEIGAAQAEVAGDVDDRNRLLD
jgi:hypothetical protein